MKYVEIDWQVYSFSTPSKCPFQNPDDCCQHPESDVGLCYDGIQHEADTPGNFPEKCPARDKN